jgi:hypothetical protein
MHFDPEYKQLDVDLPVQKLVDTRKAGIAGILLALILIFLTVLFYFKHKSKEKDSKQPKQNIILTKDENSNIQCKWN